MATRNGNHIDFIWVLFSAPKSALVALMNPAQQRLNARPCTTHCAISVNESSVVPTRCLVKVPAATGWPETLPNGLQRLIERVFTEEDQHEASILVHSENWAIPEEINDAGS